jgi:Uma2 family endonuclease
VQASPREREQSAPSDREQPERRLLPEPPPGGWLSDEPEMDSYEHLMQMLALIATMRWLWRERSDYFAAGNITIYYSPKQKKSVDFRGPDFFVVLDVDGTRPRNSWVVWEEGGKYPNVIFELLSPTTADADRGEKKQIYQDVFRTPEYFLFDPKTGELEGLRLVGGKYQPIEPDDVGRLACDQLELLVGVLHGELRFFARDGRLIAKPEEDAILALARAAEEKRRAAEEKRRADEEKRRADEEKQRADEEKQRADEEKQRADRLEALLRQHGVDPDRKG